MLEKLNTAGFESLSKPSGEALQVLDEVLQTNPDPTVAEVGLGLGATTVEILKRLDGRGTLHLYDYDDVVASLADDIAERGLAGGTRIVKHGNGRQTYNSYAWQLAMAGLQAMEQDTPLQEYDFVYLDGAHSFHHDAPATLVLREMVKPGGYLVFDDMYWSFTKSPVMNPDRKPEIREQYSQEQLERPHVEVVVKLLMETDPRFEQVYLTDNRRPYRPVFHKRADVA